MTAKELMKQCEAEEKRIEIQGVFIRNSTCNWDGTYRRSEKT